MRALFELVREVAPTDATTLIRGESGTGKELFARAIHQHSRRRAGRFVALNCSALPEGLMETELFGHQRGAFTGAATAKEGLFEAADGGTLFLDEIGDMPLSLQVKLLRALQEGEVRRVGSNASSRVDVRVLAATHVDLERAVAERRFREDLFYRLNVIPLRVPPLRERREDIPLLAQAFIQGAAARHGKSVRGVSPEALTLLEGHDWPGNVRELENVVERAVVLTRAEVLSPGDLPVELRRGGLPSPTARLPYAAAKQRAVAQFEREYVQSLLMEFGGNVTAAARSAGVDRANFRRLIRRHGVTTAPTPPEATGASPSAPPRAGRRE